MGNAQDTSTAAAEAAEGFRPLDAPPKFTWVQLQEVSALWGDFDFVKALPSERDQNLLLKGKDGSQVVLKVHNASDEVAVIECQNLALSRAAAANCNVQRLLKTRDGEKVMIPIPSKDQGPSAVCQCRVLTFLPGEMLAEVLESRFRTGDQAELLANVGTTVGSVTAAMLDMEPPATLDVDFSWDLQNCEKIISRHRGCVEAHRLPLLDRCVHRFKRDVAPLLPDLRKSMVHNDGNDYNIVVQDGCQVGLLDFGDMTYTYTCSDAAICMAYLLLHVPEGQPLEESMEPFIRCFHEACPLNELERRAIFGLALIRLCTSVCMSAYQSRKEPDNEYLLISAKPSWRLLERADDEAEALPAAAQGFLDALLAEYVDMKEAAVGRWFDSGGGETIPSAEIKILDELEERVRQAKDPSAEIKNIRAELVAKAIKAAKQTPAKESVKPQSSSETSQVARRKDEISFPGSLACNIGVVSALGLAVTLFAFRGKLSSK